MGKRKHLTTVRRSAASGSQSEQQRLPSEQECPQHDSTEQEPLQQLQGQQASSSTHTQPQIEQV